MGYDPEGTWNWKKFWKGVLKTVVIVAVVVAVAVVVGATAGTVVAVAVAAVSGGLAGSAVVAAFQDEHYNRLKETSDFPSEIDMNNFDQFKIDNQDKYIFDVPANCHQFSAGYYGQNIKILSKDGKYEAIYNKDTGKIIKDVRDIGTYNYYNPESDGFMHGIVDVVPFNQ